jgi:Arc/MetJ-type ribon-helix-helix transcriptional regulator
MLQSKFSLEDSQARFLEQCKTWGFKDKSEMVRTAIDHLQAKLELQQLRESAELYADLYGCDQDLQELTESAVLGWPE